MHVPAWHMEQEAMRGRDWLGPGPPAPRSKLLSQSKARCRRQAGVCVRSREDLARSDCLLRRKPDWRRPSIPRRPFLPARTATCACACPEGPPAPGRPGAAWQLLQLQVLPASCGGAQHARSRRKPPWGHLQQCWCWWDCQPCGHSWARASLTAGHWPAGTPAPPPLARCRPPSSCATLQLCWRHTAPLVGPCSRLARHSGRLRRQAEHPLQAGREPYVLQTAGPLQSVCGVRAARRCACLGQKACNAGMTRLTLYAYAPAGLQVGLCKFSGLAQVLCAQGRRLELHRFCSKRWRVPVRESVALATDANAALCPVQARHDDRLAGLCAPSATLTACRSVLVRQRLLTRRTRPPQPTQSQACMSLPSQQGAPHPQRTRQILQPRYTAADTAFTQRAQVEL